MQMLLYFPLFYKNRQWANQLCSWIIFIQLYISAIIAWYFWQLYMQRWNVQYKLTYCTVLLWRIFISLCVFSQYLYFCQRPTRMRSCRLPLHSLCLCLYGPLFFFCLSASYCFRYFLTCQTFSADTGLQFSVIPLSTMLPVFTINYTCFLNLFTEVWLGKSHVL